MQTKRFTTASTKTLPILSQINPYHTLKIQLLKYVPVLSSYLTISMQNGTVPSHLPIKMLCASTIPPTPANVLKISHTPWMDHPNNFQQSTNHAARHYAISFSLMPLPPAYVQTISLSPSSEITSIIFSSFNVRKNFFSYFNLHIFRHEMERRFLNPVVARTPKNFNLFSLLRVTDQFYTHGNIHTEYSHL